MDFIHHFDPSPLTLLCTVHHVSIISVQSDTKENWVGDQFTVEFYATTYESVILHCHPVSKAPCAASPKQANESILTITIPSQSQAHLQDQTILHLPAADGKAWCLDCSASDPEELATLEDVLTYFIKYENPHQIRNTLAMMDPASCQITQVIAENVYMDPPDANSEGEQVSNDDDFITTRENYYGQKLPVTMDDNVFKDGLELRKVRLIYKTSKCMDVGSDWIARGLVRAGDTIANYIQTGTKSVQETVEPANNQIVLSSKERYYIDVFYGMATMAGGLAARWFGQLFNTTSDHVNEFCGGSFHIPSPQTQLGNAAVQAAGRIMEGTVIAAGTVYAASRDSLIDVIGQKYGHDASYLAEKLLGRHREERGQDVLVYFDHQGISRRVMVQPYPQDMPSNADDSQLSMSVDGQDERHVMFDVKELTSMDTTSDTKEPVLVHV
ncbi:hypothetical protein DM01DRAFT_1337640 [Hesseltinella vesiculosa]|uniref:Senescence domain-containing protein n=1 Tax=Hesseltinella vesiculosa TaxID=101127 RepID=A0A1X2GC76_9FUNG|nr:hypothetical protein DM01DRAFT_1337640 [Hesseltinella vesiculosa]